MFIRAFNEFYKRYIDQNIDTDIYLALGQNMYLGEVKTACGLCHTRWCVPMRTVTCAMGGGP